MGTLEIGQLDLSTRELYDLARHASTFAYAPYSQFHVGSAIRTEREGVFKGCNVENASYGLTCCAERSAIFAAVAAEGDEMRIKEVVTYVEAPSGAAPCGACRQVIAEFGTNVRVLFSRENVLVDTTIAELLPDHFVPPGK
jgi:cytidine deaminase